MNIKNVLVLGAGTMGNGIAQIIAQSGYRVTLRDTGLEALNRARQTMEKSLNKFIQKQIIRAQERDMILDRVTFTTSWDAVADTDLFIEAVPEQLELKINIFKELDGLLPKHALLASNTSSLPITAIAAATKRPESVLGMHFMNPVPVMKGVELIKGRQTSEESISIAREFVRSINKIPVVAMDYAGFITSRLLNSYLNEAAYAVMDGNEPKEVDDAMVHCTNMPTGPCALMDLVGIDVIVYVLGILENEFGLRFKAAPILKQMVRAGQLGKKTGKGFYMY